MMTNTSDEYIPISEYAASKKNDILGATVFVKPSARKEFLRVNMIKELRLDDIYVVTNSDIGKCNSFYSVIHRKTQ